MVSLKGPEFLGALNGLIHITGAVVTAEDRWMPKGYNHDREAKLCELNDMWLPDVVREEIERWWLAHAERANTPNWDLLSTCTFAGRKGLVLVEAKAHANELKVEGKILSEKASEQSKRNHARIGEAIKAANDGLSAGKWGAFKISRDSHYQLSNRIAFAWKLAQLGVPTVLLYLGFLGDTGIPEGQRPFMSDAEWGRAMTDYARGVLPEDFVALAATDRAVVNCGLASFAFVIRSAAIQSVTQP
jgi:hypothetical protein